MTAVVIFAFGIIAAQLVYIVYMGHRREEIGDKADKVTAENFELKARIVERDVTIGHRDEAIQVLSANRDRLLSVVKMVETQRDEALHDLSKSPDPTGRATAARIRTSLSALSKLSASEGAGATAGGDGAEVVHDPAGRPHQP
jgi:hypothetical protein